MGHEICELSSLITLTFLTRKKCDFFFLLLGLLFFFSQLCGDSVLPASLRSVYLFSVTNGFNVC